MGTETIRRSCALLAEVDKAQMSDGTVPVGASSGGDVMPQ
jgi:hypothetical protein